LKHLGHQRIFEDRLASRCFGLMGWRRPGARITANNR
jgi:hypothetical protein